MYMVVLYVVVLYVDSPASGQKTLVYIAADSRSGSTLLDLLLGNHDQAISIGELRRLNDHYNKNLACSCNVHIRICPF
jgi:hypothetical protein